MIHNPGPMVVFATPGMLHAGLSLEIFKNWCGDEKNLVIFPGYCVAGTIGNKVISGQKRIEIDRKTVVHVKCEIAYLSFSAHVDAKGIMQLIRQTKPRNVVLVHGEKRKMQILKERVGKEFELPCFNPANGTTDTMHGRTDTPVDVSMKLLQSSSKSAAVSEPDRKRQRPHSIADDQDIASSSSSTSASTSTSATAAVSSQPNDTVTKAHSTVDLNTVTSTPPQKRLKLVDGILVQTPSRQVS
jgi:Beta-Casp domain/Zn-dependent metallo-hydrolase RNA specificity domain